MSSRSEKRPGSRERGSGGGASEAERPPREADVALVCGVSEDGQGLEIIRRRGESVEAGTVRRLEEGKPIHGEVVRLKPRESSPMLCDVEVEVPAREGRRAASSSGPPQVATETYRKNWDAIYGQGRKQRSMLN